MSSSPAPAPGCTTKAAAAASQMDDASAGPRARPAHGHGGGWRRRRGGFGVALAPALRLFQGHRLLSCIPWLVGGGRLPISLRVRDWLPACAPEPCQLYSNQAKAGMPVPRRGSNSSWCLGLGFQVLTPGFSHCTRTSEAKPTSAPLPARADWPRRRRRARRRSCSRHGGLQVGWPRGSHGRPGPGRSTVSESVQAQV